MLNRLKEFDTIFNFSVIFMLMGLIASARYFAEPDSILVFYYEIDDYAEDAEEPGTTVESNENPPEKELVA